MLFHRAEKYKLLRPVFSFHPRLFAYCKAMGLPNGFCFYGSLFTGGFFRAIKNGRACGASVFIN